MVIQVTNYVNVKDRALELACNIPTGIALLPINFDSAKSNQDLIYESSASTVRALLREAGIKETKIENEGDKFLVKQEKSFDWIGPTLFIGASIVSNNPDLISITEGIISNYLTDYFKGFYGHRKVKLDIIIEKKKDREYKRVKYEGDGSDLPHLSEILHEL